MDSRTLALLCRQLADNKKAENLVVLDVRNLSSITDYFVLASGATEPHLRAIVSEVQDRLRTDHALRPRAIEGDFRVARAPKLFADRSRGGIRQSQQQARPPGAPSIPSYGPARK